MIFYIADTHFGHAGVLKMSNRPFASIEEHDQILIETWNSTVSDRDIVYIVGDFCYRSKESAEFYLKKLRGKKILIIGNHDLKYLNKLGMCKDKYFEAIYQMTMIKDGDEHVVLCHYPLLEWSGYFRGWYHVHGHIHNNKTNPAVQFLKTQNRALNAGVDINNFRPVTLQELIQNNKFFKANILTEEA